jgi:hypothetical protein
MTTSRDAIDLSGFTKAQREALDASGTLNDVASSGLNCQNLVEPVPQFDRADCDSGDSFKGKNNAWIVLGRDRPAGLETGYGGLGQTQAGAVDIVVGRMAGTNTGPMADRRVAPNFFTDAARIYVSQKTDIDSNFALVGDTQSIARSGIGIKADAVRLIGREGVKIVTGKGKNLGGVGQGGERNSQGGEIETVAGIELIAGNDVESEALEPIAKAGMLAETLTEIVDYINSLANIVNEMAKNQSQLNQTLATHTHEVPQAPTGVTKSLPAIDLAVKVGNTEVQNMSNVHQNLYKFKVRLGTAFTLDRLSPGGSKWFGSRFNKTN